MTAQQQKQEFYQYLKKAGQEELRDCIQENAILAPFTTMRVGGSADLLAAPKSLLQCITLYKGALEVGLPVFILGNGSNVVVSDQGIEGLVIQLDDRFAQIHFEEDPHHDQAVLVHAYSGALLSKVANACAERGLAGMEFAAGIPGSIGGAVYMNAGAYGGQMSDVVYQTLSLSKDQGELVTLTEAEHEYGYRQSYFLQKGGVILSTILRLFPGDKTAIREQIQDLNQRRSNTQPLAMPSAGSVFKRPEGYFAGTLIQEAGLKGFTIGQAQVSEKHAGFIVNLGQATAADVFQLMKAVQQKVWDKFQVKLEPEIRFIGRGF